MSVVPIGMWEICNNPMIELGKVKGGKKDGVL